MPLSYCVKMPCGYFTDKIFYSEMTYHPDYSAQNLESYLEEGYRHFGSSFFKPVCLNCKLCIPYRIPRAGFIIKKWQRRILRRNITIKFNEPDKTLAFKLYSRHKIRFAEESRESFAHFTESFFHTNKTNKFISIYSDDEELIGVSHYDKTDSILSAVYSYYDHVNYKSYSIGSLIILTLIEMMQREGQDYLYLGYYIPGHPHMNYKSRFYPAEILERDGLWQGFHKNDTLPT